MMETCGASGRGSVKGDKSLVVFGPPDAQPTTRLRLSQPAARNPVDTNQYALRQLTKFGLQGFVVILRDWFHRDAAEIYVSQVRRLPEHHVRPSHQRVAIEVREVADLGLDHARTGS